MDISTFITSYRRQKYNNIQGVVLAKSPLQRSYFLVQLQCRQSMQAVTVVIQGQPFWYCYNFCVLLLISY